MTASLKLKIADHAVDMAMKGHRVFPVVMNSKKPVSMGWQELATNDCDKVRMFWSSGVNPNYGVRTGGDTFVLDVDLKGNKRGDVALDDLQAISGDLPGTLTVSTPSGGQHYYFKTSRPVTNSVCKIGDGLDIRGEGGFVVGPGSRINGVAYTVVNDAEIAMAPDWLIAMCGAPLTRVENAIVPLSGINPDRAEKRGVKYLATAPVSREGEGGDLAAFKVAARLKDEGLSRDEAVDLMLEHWNSRCEPPWSVDELATKVDNAYAYGKERPGSAAPEAVFTAVAVPSDVPTMPDYKRGEGGAIVATMLNIKSALDRPDQCGARIAFDEFKCEIAFAPTGTNDWRPMVDADYTRIRFKLEQIGFRKVTTQDLRDVILSIAEEQRFDSAKDWINALKWDGKPRVDAFFGECFQSERGEYATAVSRYWWTGLAGRVLDPGCQADMVPVLVGGQGIGKTQGCKAIAPAAEHFIEIDLGARDDDLARKMRGALVGEIGELRGLSSRDSESVKAWITRTEENWRQLYREFVTRYPRRLMMIATTNSDQFLADETGERRWLPMRSAGVNVAAIKAQRDQLWAEGAVLFRKHGVLWQDALRLATDQHDEFKLGDVWSEPISKWLDDFGDEAPDSRGFSKKGKWKRADRPFRMGDLLLGALNITTPGQTKLVEMRAAKVLRGMGWKDGRHYFDGRQARGWRKEGPAPGA